MSVNPFGDSLENTSGKEIAGEKDTLGGFRIHDSGAYPITLTTIYAGVSDGGAKSVTFVGKMEDGSEYSWTEWVTAGTAKGGKNFTINEKTGEPQYLPGFNRANAIAMLTLEKEFKALAWAQGIIKKYSKTAQAEVNTEVFMCRELEGKVVLVGIQKQIVNKQVQNQTTKKWEDTNEKREVNEVDKIFQIGTRRTLQEALAKQPEGEFITKWLEANKEPRDRFKEVKNAPGGGVAGAPGGNDKPTSSLFS